MSEETIYHIITSRLQEAYGSHHPRFRKEIEDIKHLFIVNIKQAIYEKKTNEKYSLDKLKNILEESDFDWLDYNKFDEFVKLVCGVENYNK